MIMVEIRTKPVRATLVDDIVAARITTPGAFKYFTVAGNIAGLNYVCPCGCGAIAPLNFKPEPSPSWHWDGNRQTPTLQPSVHHRGHWHGWLRGGTWVSC